MLFFLDFLSLFSSFTFILILAVAASHWILSLYFRQPGVLSSRPYFPKERLLRILLLSVGFFACSIAISDTSDLCHLCWRLLPCFFLLLTICTDIEYEVIFDRMLFPFVLCALPAIYFQQLPLLPHLAAAAAGGIISLLFAIITRGGIGGGDIKLLAALGLWLGPEKLLSTAVGGIILGGILALSLLLAHKKNRKEKIPFGPGFALTAILCLLFT
jgi:leader peptidase (prepilin peptidase)/N-methyltransferase